MNKTIFYASALPRSGSVLLQNIIAQNPKFHTTPNSGVFDLINAALGAYRTEKSFDAQDRRITDKRFVSFCTCALHGYYDNITAPVEYIIDKNPAWGIAYDIASHLNPNAKVIYLVRDLRSIFASMETIHRHNTISGRNNQNPETLTETTVRKRMDALALSAPVGLAIDRLRDVIDQGIDEKILFVRYEDLVQDPQGELDRIYKYLEVEPYNNHYFTDIAEKTKENPRVYGISKPDLIAQDVEVYAKKYEEILGFQNCADIKKTYAWFYNYFNYI